jgi:hypothetical protein
MTTHGHRLISDVIHGTTITKVRHESDIPLFLVKAHMDLHGRKMFKIWSGDCDPSFGPSADV